MRVFGATQSSGGGGTVHTDGVTITGNGSGGSPIALLDAMTDGVTLQGAGISASKLALKAVQTDGTLTGAGTVASPLSSIGPTFHFFSGGSYGQNFAVPQNQTLVFGFLIPYRLQVGTMYTNFATPDGSNNSDVGIYSAAGSLLANYGAQHLGSFAEVLPFVQGTVVFPAGEYYIAYTTAGTSLITSAGFSTASFVVSNTAGVTSGGALAGSITPPARSVSGVQALFALTT